MKTAACLFIGASPEILIRKASHCMSLQNVCHVSIYLNAQWEKQDGDVAIVIVQVELIQTEMYLPGSLFPLRPHSMLPCVPFPPHLWL